MQACERNGVLARGFDFFRRACDGFQRVAFHAARVLTAGFDEASFQRCGDGDARCFGVLAFVPHDGQFFKRYFRAPSGVREHGDGAVVYAHR